MSAPWYGSLTDTINLISKGSMALFDQKTTPTPINALANNIPTKDATRQISIQYTPHSGVRSILTCIRFFHKSVNHSMVGFGGGRWGTHDVFLSIDEEKKDSTWGCGIMGYIWRGDDLGLLESCGCMSEMECDRWQKFSVLIFDLSWVWHFHGEWAAWITTIVVFNVGVRVSGISTCQFLKFKISKSSSSPAENHLSLKYPRITLISLFNKSLKICWKISNFSTAKWNLISPPHCYW